MVALGQHLGTDENIGIALFALSSAACIAPLRCVLSLSTRVMTRPENGRRQCFFDALGSLTERLDGLAAFTTLRVEGRAAPQ